jgi:hypothetical protein
MLDLRVLKAASFASTVTDDFLRATSKLWVCSSIAEGGLQTLERGDRPRTEGKGLGSVDMPVSSGGCCVGEADRL